MTHINIVKFKELFKIEDLLEYFGRKCFNRDIVAEIFSILVEEEFSIVETNTTNKIVLTYSIIKPKTTHNYLSKIIAMVDLDVNHNYKFFELIYTNYMNDLVNQKLDDKKKLTISEINSINDMYSKVNSMEFVPKRSIETEHIMRAYEMIMKSSEYLDKMTKNLDNLLDKTILHDVNDFNTFHFDDEFFYDVIIKFQEYCKTQCSFFSGNIFDYDFVGEFIDLVKNDKVTFSYSTHEVIINGDKMQFPRFKKLREITEMLENYYITILYFNDVYSVPANKLAHSSNSHQL